MEASHTFSVCWRLFIRLPDPDSLAVSLAVLLFSAGLQTVGPALCLSYLELLCRVTYGRTLESSTFQFSTPDFVYMLMFGMACMLVCARHARPFLFSLPVRWGLLK